ncbi:glycosyltransferase [Ascidiimonas sp. W6]|uniref:glycosyltransferase n=1 Tax=Ascidiimonas meishanensis TaxID=3128903 RepID=UPI0030EF724D
MKLLVISHTEHYKDISGNIVGLASTVTELNHLLDLFDEIYHIGVLYNTPAPGNTLPYQSDKVTFVPIKPSGGKQLKDKLSIVFQAPENLLKVNKYLAKVDCFQFRAPTGMGVYMIPYLSFFTRKRGWFKYAGNWKQESAPKGYALQRWMLKKQSRYVTVNGKWADAPSHCIPFENPSLSIENRCEGEKSLTKKASKKPFNLCFVGRLEDAKGVDKILQAFAELSEEERATFKIHFIGNGAQEETYRQAVKKENLPVTFYGSLPQKEVFEQYKKCDFLLLPSKSEGFPKVIGEAMNFGCIPITSNVSSIGQYVKDGENGFLIAPNTAEELKHIFKRILKAETALLQQMIFANYRLAAKFTYANYIDRIKYELLADSIAG